ncbi:MAG: AAA family ATPase [Candidatus Eisenbacteria bacterium]
MKVSKVSLEGFGVFSAPVSWSFSQDRLNIVYGKNESGKSTLMSAVLATLFGFESKEEERTSRSWAASPVFRASVELSIPGGLVRFSRDFSSNHVLVTKLADGKSTDIFSGEVSPRSRGEERRAYTALLDEHFGFWDGLLARRTCFVGQLDMETEFEPKLRELISGAGPSGYEGVLERLTSRFAELTMENPWGSARRKKRAIEEAQDQLGTRRRELEEAQVLLGTSGQAAARCVEIEKELDVLRRRRGEERSFLDKLQRYLELRKTLRTKEELLDSESRASREYENARKKCESAREDLERGFPHFSALTVDISDTLSRAARTDDEVERLEVITSEAPAAPEPGLRGLSGKFIAVSAAAVLAAFVLIGLAVGKLATMIAAGIVVSLLSAVLLRALSARMRRSTKETGKETGELKSTRERLQTLKAERERLVSEIEAALPQAHRNLARTLRPRELTSQFERFTVLKRQVEVFEKGLTQEAAGKHEEAHARALRDTGIAKSQLDEFLAERTELLPLAEAPEKAVQMAEDSRKKLGEIDDRIEALDKELRQKQIDYARVSALAAEPPETYLEEIAELERKLAKLTLRRDALRLAVETLDGCRDEYQAGSKDRIASRISDLFAVIVCGRYDAVRLSKDFEPTLVTCLSRDVTPAEISTGARDQLHFCMRLAMTEELSGGKKLPLILDDPFVNFDDERLERVRHLLLDLVRRANTQVIIFTHNERHLGWEANVIKLD